MDDHERRMWTQMLERIEAFRVSPADLGGLLTDLRGLFVEADPRDHSVRDDFDFLLAALDGEYEFRTEAWAPPGAMSDENLAAAIGAIEVFVSATLRGGDSTGRA